VDEQEARREQAKATLDTLLPVRRGGEDAGAESYRALVRRR